MADHACAACNATFKSGKELDEHNEREHQPKKEERTQAAAGERKP